MYVWMPKEVGGYRSPRNLRLALLPRFHNNMHCVYFHAGTVDCMFIFFIYNSTAVVMDILYTVIRSVETVSHFTALC